MSSFGCAGHPVPAAGVLTMTMYGDSGGSVLDMSQSPPPTLSTGRNAMTTASTKIHIDVDEQGGGAHRSPWTFAAGACRTLPVKVMRWRTLRTMCATSSPSTACHTLCWAGTRWAARSPNSSRRKSPKGWSGWCSLPLRLQRSWRCPQRCAKAWKAPIRAASVKTIIDKVRTAKLLAEDQRKQMIEDSLRGGAVAKIAGPRYTSQEDISAAVRVGPITVPTLVIAGELDRVDSVSTLETELLTCIPHVVMRMLCGTGHLSPLESPRDIAELLGQFLASLAPEAATLNGG